MESEGKRLAKGGGDGKSDEKERGQSGERV